MASTETINGDKAFELIVCESSDSSAESSGSGAVSKADGDEITPLLIQSEKPKISIFSLSDTRKKPRELATKLSETEMLPLTKCSLWLWSGSRYSGLLCMALSSMIYFCMEVISVTFSAQPIPLFETAFTRCTIILILSYVWLRRSKQSIVPTQARRFMVLRAVMGCLSLLSFVYSIQRIPLSEGIVLSFTTPIVASLTAIVIFKEKPKIVDIGGLACSFFGVLFIFRQIFSSQEGIAGAGEETSAHVNESHHIYAVLVGLFSSISGGISYCLIKAGAKASDQPVITVFSFGILTSPAAGLCMFVLEEAVIPGFYSIILMLVLGGLAFLAEVLLARGLQLEKTSKVANLQFIEVAFSQLWGICLSRIDPSFTRLVGCFLILISFCSTVYIGPDKEME